MPLDPYELGLTLAGIGGTAAGIALPNPLVAGLGVSALGSGLQALGTDTVETGPSDEQIAAASRLARRSRTSDINTQARQRQRMAAAQAAQGGTLQSGMYGAAVRDIDAGRGRALDALEADLAQTNLGILSQRRYVPSMNGLGLAGRLVSSVGSPLASMGALQLAREGFTATNPLDGPPATLQQAATASRSLSGATPTPAPAPAPRVPTPDMVAPLAESWLDEPRAPRRPRGNASIRDVLGYEDPRAYRGVF